MPVQRSQGRIRPLVPRVDELPSGVASPAAQPPTAEASAAGATLRTGSDELAKREAAAALGALGGLAKAARDRELAAIPALARGLGLREVSAAELKPYLDDASDFAERECCRLAREVGGGSIGAGPSSIVGTAALQLAGSRLCFARGELIAASRLGDASRANLLSAHELTAKEAKARPRKSPADILWEAGAAERARVAAAAQAAADAEDNETGEGDES